MINTRKNSDCNSRVALLIFFLIHYGISYSQDQIILAEPLKIIAQKKVASEIKKEDVLHVMGIAYKTGENNDRYCSIIAKNVEGGIVTFSQNYLKNFTFPNIDNIIQLWDKILLLNGTYENLLTLGYQYNLRSENNNTAIEYLNELSKYDIFFNDNYLEDYIYSLITKIHKGILNDKRPGNINIKIIKDPIPNAWVISNGCVFITTGLLSLIQTEDELVGVLSHEIAHFVLDHQMQNYNKTIEQRKKAEFWATFATVLAAGTDAILSANYSEYIPGSVTANTAILSTIISNEVLSHLGISYNYEQEFEADRVAKDILRFLKYDTLSLAVTLERIKKYFILTGNYIAFSGSGTHPSLESRINNFGQNTDLIKFNQHEYHKKVSFVNSYNAWIELWFNYNHFAALDLVNKNIDNNVATESDYIVKAVILRRMSNSLNSNNEVLRLLEKAKSLNVTPYIVLHKEEGITFLRLNDTVNAKKSFEKYLYELVEMSKRNTVDRNRTQSNEIINEIEWTKKMIFKIGK